MKVAIWARVSTAEQHTSNQLTILQEWAERRGDEVVARFVTEDSAWQQSAGPKGKAFVKEFAYTPFTGLTIAPRSDNREEVAPRPDGAETFAHAVVDTAPAES